MGNSRQCLFCSLAAQPSTEINAAFIFSLSLSPENTMMQEMRPTCQLHLSAARLPPLFFLFLPMPYCVSFSHSDRFNILQYHIPEGEKGLKTECEFIRDWQTRRERLMLS